MPKPSYLLSSYSPNIRSSFIVFLLLFLAVLLAACTPDTTISQTPIEITADNSTQPREIESPEATSPVAATATLDPNNKPQFLSVPTSTLQFTAQLTTDENEPIKQYRVSEAGYPVGMLSDGSPLLFLEEEDVLSVVELDGLKIRPRIGNIIRPIIPLPLNNLLVAPVNNNHKQYPVWQISVDSDHATLLGTTTGFSPLFSATADGKVLIIENGHLVLKWLGEQTVESLPLTTLENLLALDWANYDLTQFPDENNWETPWINFSISPDGQWVAIFDGKQAKLWLATIDGQVIQEIPLNPTTLLEQPGEGKRPYVIFSGWSSDSRQVAYREGIFWTRPPSMQIKIANISGEEPIPITSVQDTIGGYLAWSPDGQTIAFSSVKYRDLPERSRGSDLFIANADGSNPQKISEIHHAGSVSSLLWQPDGQALIFTCWGENAIELCSYSLDK